MGIPTAERKRLWRLSREMGRPLYQQIQEVILGHIQSGVLAPGDLLPSYPWLSRTLGVADKTVRQAYANLQQAGVLEIMKGKGTFVARERVGRNDKQALRTGVVGVVPPGLPIQASEEALFWPMLRAIYEAAYGERLDTLMLARSGDFRSAGVVERLADPKRLDGLIVLASSVDEMLRRLVSFHVPVVLAGAWTPEVAVDCVVFDIASAARDLTYRLIGEGHRRIGLVRVPRGLPSRDLEAGYRHAMGSAELPVKPSWVIHIDVDLGESGLAVVSGLIDEEVTAAVTFNAGMAATVAREVLRRGRTIPGDVSLASVLTTDEVILPGGTRLAGVRLEAADLGRAAVKRISELLGSGDPVPRRETIEAQMIKGESVGSVSRSSAPI